ncbi:MAG: acetylornithine deacetylase/succinyldiaminopimelate desuccinylase-like deacylase, partial [Acidimicrobiales bacterium]|nr:acetylornithine deacetylase/succinyldiaminopimelate desuccinylase-like deacylase [Acidimicrobiales bacterium]
SRARRRRRAPRVLSTLLRMDDPTAEVTDLLQHLIRNECVNDGTATSGGEARSVDVLQSYLDVPGIDIETYEPQPGRQNLVARIEGSDPSAPTLCLMGHTDVVPVNPDGWRRDPFGGELVDGEVWGRGAIDMLNLTASMAVATKGLATSGFRPKGTLIYLAVADEEALGTWGAEHLVEHERDAVQADYVITESGGIPIPGFGPQGGIKLPVLVGEKGCFWTKLTVKGTPGHGSQPFRTDNALVKAAEVVRRITEHRGETDIHDTWRGFVQGLDLPPELAEPLLDPDRFWDALDALPDGMARQFHACTHTTVSANIVHGGQKINIIPDTIELELDIRSLPGWDAKDVEAMLVEAIGPDLVDHVRIDILGEDPSTISPIDTPLWDVLTRTTKRFYADSATIPMLMVGATDARFFRRVGATAYGFGLFSQNLSYEDFATMFHGDDERVDVESLRLSTELWDAVARDLLS